MLLASAPRPISSGATLSATTKPKLAGFGWLRLAALALILLGGYEIYRVYLGSNFHVVLPGKIYRHAQPTPEQLRELVTVHAIRTVVNLRGCGHPFEWYMDECRTVGDCNITQEDLSFSANRVPSATELRRLVEVLERAEYPLLLHCRRGADRTGMASVIALLVQTDMPLAEARRQLGPRFGHVRVSKTAALDEFFDRYEAYLRDKGMLHDRAAFRHWILNEYGDGYSYRWEEFTPLEREVRTGEPIGFRVKLRNTGSRTWQIRAGIFAGMHLGFELYGPGNERMTEGRAGRMDREVRSGEDWEVTLVVPPISKAGRYRLFVDMVEENNCWFHQTGAEPHERELIVRE